MRASFFPAVLTCLAIVGVYWFYALTVVPLVEPVHEGTNGLALNELDHGTQRNDNLSSILSAYFPSEHWLHKQSPKVIESEQGLLLFTDYDTAEDGRVSLTPCVLIFFPNPREHGAAVPTDAVVLESPDGACLLFNGGFQPGRGKIGRFDGGSLNGPVKIHTRLQGDGEPNDLIIQASNVQINERRIWSDSKITFALGPNHGHGKNLEIRFLPAAEAGGPRRQGLDIGGVQSIEIIRDVDVTFYLGDAELLSDEPRPLAAKQKPTLPPAAQANNNQETPSRITCDGSFYFHLQRREAEFDKNVRVVQINPTGPADQMTCQTLSLFFARRAGEEAGLSTTPDAASNAAGANELTLSVKRSSRLSLRPTRIEAIGAPVRLDAYSRGVHAMCEQLTYDIAEQRVRLVSTTPGRDVTLQWKHPDRSLEIHCPTVWYRLDPIAPKQRLGTLEAAGPGRLWATDADRDVKEAFTASWTDKAYLSRQKGQPVLSIIGTPKLGLGGLGNLVSNEMHLWLIEPLPQRADTAGSSKPRRPFVLPDRLAAIGDVHIESPQLTADSNKLEVWFRHVADPATDNDTKRIATDIPSHANGRGRVYDMKAGLLRLELQVTGMMDGGRADANVKNLTATGNVSLKQQLTEANTPSPLELHGYRLHVRNADSTNTHITLAGSADGRMPNALASITARGAALRGRMIQLDRAANRLWIDSPGEMTLPLDLDLSGRPLEQPQPVTVAWQQSMDFNGQDAVFTGAVLVQGEGAWMRTERLTATMVEPISFTAKTTAKPDIERLLCDGQVVVDRRESDTSGQIGHEHFDIASLSIERHTGNIEGRGPGWMTSVRYAGAEEMFKTSSRQTTRPNIIRGQSPNRTTSGWDSVGVSRTLPTSSSPSRLQYLRVDFQNGLRGNLNQRRLSVHGQVHAIYGPVDSWEQTITVDGPGWRNGATALDCDHLTVSQRQVAAHGQSWVEMSADGNVAVEGYTPQYGAFNAQAERLSYDQRKDLLVLDGNAGEARLWRESTNGTPAGKLAARKIFFRRSQNRVSVEDMRSLDLSQFSGR